MKLKKQILEWTDGKIVVPIGWLLEWLWDKTKDLVGEERWRERQNRR